jgi:hypothetical protein
MRPRKFLCVYPGFGLELLGVNTPFFVIWGKVQTLENRGMRGKGNDVNGRPAERERPDNPVSGASTSPFQSYKTKGCPARTAPEKHAALFLFKHES